MLGVLKRRWKPKRAGAGRDGGGRLGKPGLEPDLAVDKNRTPTSPRQIHPMCEEKLQLVAYEGDLITETLAPPGGQHQHQYPLAPNICVEGGRIEFIKAPPPTDSATVAAPPPPAPAPDVLTSPPAEKTDIAKECLEARIKELEAELEEERRTSQRERLQVAKLQRQLQRREVLQRDVDRERRLRLDSECRLRTSASEAERCRARLQALQREFSRMEETVRSMLQYKSRYDQLKHDKHQLSIAYENRVQQFQNALSKLNQENEALKKQLHTLEAAGAGEVQTALIERLRELEQDNRSLTRESDAQRRQYERCLDDVANQVVRALLAQKSLREEIETLQQRVRDLETQNRTLSTLLLQQITSVTSASETTRSNPTIKLALPAPGRPASCDDARLRLWRDSVVWLPLQRPSSLDLDCCQYRHRAHPNVPRLAGGKEEDEGSESPESGNRDEGYSTMSSDVQGPGEATARRGLEDLKEASDETDTPHTTTSSPDRLPEPDLVLIPLSLALSVGSPSNRHSFPPVRDLLPFQHVMRSFSDSHLCLKLASSAAPSSYSLTSAESVLLQGCHYAGVSGAPLRHSQRSRGANTLLNTTLPEEEDDSGSWCSGDWWDADYVQHWLRLDETRSALQQQMEYDAAELEDWTMDPAEDSGAWRSSGHPALTHSQTLPSIQESIAAELEEDSSECLWNSSSYLSAGDFKEAGRSLWPYNRCLVSPGGDSWSSVSEDANGGSKRSSAAMSTDSGDLSAIGTDFTRDFYRLVKFESTKSLASTSSRSQAGDSTFRRGDIPPHFPSDREQALQSVLHFIAEQQQYVLSREVLDTRPAEISLEEMSPDLSEEFTSRETAHEIAQICEEVKRLSVVENEVQTNTNNKRASTSSEILLNEYNTSTSLKNDQHSSSKDEVSKQNLESLIVNGESSIISSSNVQNSSNQKLNCGNRVPLNSSKETSQALENTQQPAETGGDKIKSAEVGPDQDNLNSLPSRSLRVEIGRAELRPVPEEDEEHPAMSESLTSTLSTPETVLKGRSLPSSDVDQTSSMADSMDSTAVLCSDEPVLVNGSKTLNFHERATSKDVIDELNRMIRKGEEKSEEVFVQNSPSNLDMACCCPTGWVHVEREIDFTDPKARANLLDVMLAASRSSSSAATTSSSSTSSSSSSAANSESGDEPQDYQHLHRLHRFRRQKKASATREPLGALRCPSSVPRVSIIGRDDFFVRYGDKEREAVASFDFLEELSTTSVSGASSCDQPPVAPLRDPPSPSHLSLSDSCAASFSGSEPSLDVQ